MANEATTQSRPCWWPDKWNTENPADVEKRLADAGELALFEFAEKHIWLSAYARNNSRSDFHWMADAAYAECAKRDRFDIYEKAFRQAQGKR